MPRLKAAEIELSQEARLKLTKLVTKHKTGQQLAKRAQIILAACDGKSHSQIAQEVAVSRSVVQRWRSRWLMFSALPLAELSVQERLADSARSGAPARITADQRCLIEKLACEKPEENGRPVTHWTNREIADELIQQGIVKTISPRHAGRLLKRCGHQAPPHSLLADASTR